MFISIEGVRINLSEIITYELEKVEFSRRPENYLRIIFRGGQTRRFGPETAIAALEILDEAFGIKFMPEMNMPAGSLLPAML